MFAGEDQGSILWQGREMGNRTTARVLPFAAFYHGLQKILDDIDEPPQGSRLHFTINPSAQSVSSVKISVQEKSELG